MLPGRTAAFALLLLISGALSLTRAAAAEPSVGFNGWTNVQGVVEGTINVHPVNATLPKPVLGYVDYLPKGYNPSDTSTRWPVVFALLGAGQQGDGTDTDANLHQLRAKMTSNGPLFNVASQAWDFPCIVISPQAAGPWSNPTTIKSMVDYVKANYRVDTARMYMTGLADGSAGTLRFAIANPGVLAGIIPIEPTYGPTTSAETDALKRLPMWMVQCFSDQSLNRRNAIAWFNQVTLADTGLASDLMAAYPGYGANINHYACDTTATGLPLSPAGPAATVTGAALTSGSATVALPAGNLIANAGSFFVGMWGGSDAAPFVLATFGADPTTYVVKSVSATTIVLTHPYTGATQTADAHIITPNGLVVSGYYQPATGTWAWPKTSGQTPPPAGSPDNRVFTMFWQYDNTNGWFNTYLNGQVWDWLFSRAPVTTTATLALGGLTTTFTGGAQAATVTTSPTGLAVNVTYNGAATLPVNAGTYAVAATVSDPVYTGSASGTMTIAPAALGITLSGLSATYDGAPKAATITTAPAGVAVTITYNGGPVPVEPGSYAVAVASANANFIGSAVGTLVIAKATATIALGQLAATFDGTPKAVTPSTVPAGLPVTVTYGGSFTAPSALGSYTVVATVIDPHYQGAATGTLTIAGASASVTLAGLSATYDGTAHAATVTTSPAGLSISVTYDGGPTVPVSAGAHAVVATVTDPNFTGSASGTLTIAAASATVTLSGLSATYDGAPHAATVTTAPAGLATSVTYDGLATVPVASGPHVVVATIIDPNYTGSASGALTIATASATVTLSGLAATYDGAAHAATVTTVPAGLAITITYDGAAAVPVNAGPHAVIATVNDPNVIGSASGTLTIATASATVTLSGLGATYDGAAHAATVTTVPAGLATTITYDGAAAAPVNAGPHAVAVTINNANYTGSAVGALVIAPASATVTLSGLSATYDGAAHAATVTTAPAGLATTVTYDGAAAVPVAAGDHAVVATVTNPNYTGSASATLTIANAGPAPTEPTVGYNGWTNVPGVVEGSIVVYPVDTTLPKPPLGFVAYFPKGYNQADTTTKWPVVMYLAGIGEAGDGTNTAANGFQLYGHMTTHGPLYQIVNFAWDFPAIIIAPQAPANWNSTNSIKAEMEYVKTNLRADPKHLYLTGLCDGACGVLRYAATYPNDPAAILPIEAGVMPGTGQAAAIKNIPTWAAHCFADPESTARTVSIAWVDGSTGADAGVTSDCMANYPGYGATPRNHYACDSDPLTGFPVMPNGPTSSFNATLTSANKYVAFNASIGSSIYLMWSASTDAQPFARFYVPTGTANADFWAKAGVMLRDSTDSGSKQAIVAQMPNNEVTFQWRDTTNGGSDWIGVRVGGSDLVKTVKLVKTGNLFTAMYSTDGVNFIAMGSHTIVFDNATYRAGLEVSAHNNGTTYTQTFSKVAINGAAPALTDGDIGTPGNPAFAGSASLTGGVYTVTGSGSDIWDNNDHFNYDSQAASGDTTISAQVGANVTYYPMATVYPTGFYATKPYVGATGTTPITVVTPIGYNVTGSFSPATGWSWARNQHLDTSKPGKHIFTMFWYEDHVQGWRDTWGNPEVWNWLFSQTHP